ncbi:MAG: hypothetical protein AAGB46_16000 [Verrucomicrobiota bacterium]
MVFGSAWMARGIRFWGTAIWDAVGRTEVQPPGLGRQLEAAAPLSGIDS